MHVHDIPDTPEVRAKIEAGTAEGMTRLGLKAGTVEVWEDGFRSKDELDRSFEWWYFDMHLDDGSTLVVTYNTKPHTHPEGPLTPSVLVIHRSADGTRMRRSEEHPADTFSAATDRCDVRIGPNTVQGDLDHYSLHVEVEGLVADLSIDRGAPAWRPGAGVNYFDKAQTQFLAWVVPVPYGTVEGTITVDGTSRDVDGAAYHDHNWGNRVMSAGLDHWFWGRARIEDFTVVYVRMTTKAHFGVGAINLPSFYLAKGDRILTDDLLPLRLETSDDVDGPGHQTYPTKLTWTWKTDAGHVAMRITNVEMIEALDMADESAGFWHRLTHAGDHPMYYDFNADMELEVDLAGVSETVRGRTLFEKMMFR